MASTAQTMSRRHDRGRREGTATRRRSGRLAVLLTAAAIALAACSSAPSSAPGSSPATVASLGTGSGATTATQPASGNASSGQSSNFSAALKYSQCMRSHGVSDFPDPDANGGFNLNASNVELNSPTFQAAQRTCQKYMSAGAPSVRQAAQDLADLLRYAKCMRAHGVLNYPDPTAGDPPGFHFPPNFDLTSPSVVAADRVCHSLLPKGGEGHGP